MIWNIDMDGVIVPNTNEELLFSRATDNGLSFEDTSSLWDWYDKLIHDNPLPLNHSLLRFLSTRKEMGDTIRLWTNRAYTLKGYTMDNLGDYISIFDSSTFCGGCKSKYQVEGVVVDNDVHNLTCGDTGILYKF